MTDKIAPNWEYSNLPTAFTDLVSIGWRGDENIILLQFISHLPDRMRENFRTMITKEDAKSFMDNLAAVLDYYPVKQVKIKKTRSLKVSETD